MKTLDCLKIKIFAVLCVLPLFFWHCSRHDHLVGKYHASGGNHADRIPADLELHANGKGLWSIETDNASFRWDLNRDKIRLHTPSGGVIEGTIQDDTIHIALPGMGPFLFKRME